MLTVYVHADAANLGDRLTEIGAKYLVNLVLGWHPFYTLSLRWSHLIGNYLPLDTLILVGSPWFWDCCQASTKYQTLRQLNALDFSTRAALGIGSNYPLNSTSVPEGQDWLAFDTVVTRDPVAHKLANSLLLGCPSLFCAQALGIAGKASQNRLLVYANLDCGSISAEHLAQADKLQFEEYQASLIHDRVPVIAMTRADSDAFLARYGYAVPCLEHPHAFLSALLPFKEVISARVHACAAALSLGRSAVIWPIDTRAYTVVGCGAESLLPLPAPPISIDHSLESWLHVLHQTLKA